MYFVYTYVKIPETKGKTTEQILEGAPREKRARRVNARSAPVLKAGNRKLLEFFLASDFSSFPLR